MDIHYFNPFGCKYSFGRKHLFKKNKNIEIKKQKNKKILTAR